MPGGCLDTGVILVLHLRREGDPHALSPFRRVMDRNNYGPQSVMQETRLPVLRLARFLSDFPCLRRE